MFNDLSSIQSYLSSRRSGRPREMIAPGPNLDQLKLILQTALRTPDHGKLAPWRFITIAADKRDALADVMAQAFRNEHPEMRDGQIDAATAMAHMAPSLTLLIYSPKESPKIPEQEQFLSAGAVGMNMLHAAHAQGFVASWITGWACYDEYIRNVFCSDNERIIGFFYIGIASDPLIERPRPDSALHIVHWTG